MVDSEMIDSEIQLQWFLYYTVKVCEAVAKAIEDQTDESINELPHWFYKLRTVFDYIRENEDLKKERYTKGRNAAIRLMFDLIDYLSILQTKLKRNVERDNNTWILSCDLMDSTAFEFYSGGKKMEPYVHIEEHVGKEAMEAILPYASEELCRALESLYKKLDQKCFQEVSNPVGKIKDSVVKVRDKLCSNCGYSLKIPEKIPIYNEEQAVNNINALTEGYKKPIAELVEARAILRVPTWSGEWVYPAFQFEKDIAPIIQRLLPNVPNDKNPNGNNSQWPLTLYLYQALKKNRSPESEYETRKYLRYANQWKPDWRAVEEDEETQIESDTSQAGSYMVPFKDENNLYRVARTKRSPYYYENSNRKDKDDGTGRFGRLSPSHPKAGASYFADSARGTWSESLASRLTLSLDDVLGRVFFHIRVKCITESKLINLLVPNLGDSAVKQRRPVSQKLAARLLDTYPDVIGVKYPLKTSDVSGGNAYTGYAIWGLAGAQNPTSLAYNHAWEIADNSTTSRGIWTGDQDAIPALQDGSGLVDYLKRREEVFPYYPIALWRFPPLPENDPSSGSE